MESFIAGFAYGGTTVVVGQPLDTVKTILQTKKNESILSVSKKIYQTGGITAFYRGGVPLLVGGGLMRSAQFGFYKNTLQLLRSNSSSSPEKVMGLDPHVVIAGFSGGIGRGMVEGPFEFLKVRRQIQTSWNYSDVLKGSGTTMVRNAFLFASFAIYMDFWDRFKLSENVSSGIASFLKGGCCANMAWLTIWPLDVAKTRMQSGKYGNNVLKVIGDSLRSGDMYRGLIPGLTRSFIANGSSMVVYNIVETELKKQWGRT